MINDELRMVAPQAKTCSFGSEKLRTKNEKFGGSRQTKTCSFGSEKLRTKNEKFGGCG